MTSKSYAWLAIMVLCVLSVASQALAEGVRTDAAVAPPQRERPLVLPRSLGHGAWLQSKSRVEAPSLDVAALLREDAAKGGMGPQRVGVEQAVGIDSRKDGEWVRLENGQWMWVLRIAAPGARALRVQVSPWAPPPGCELLVYNAARPEEVYGPYTAADGAGARSFWTATAFAEELRIEYTLAPGMDHLDAATQLAIPKIDRWYRGFGDEAFTAEMSCHLDVTCYPAWATEAAAVGLTAFRTVTGYTLWCSGSLLNRIPQDSTAFFATATHCNIDPTNVDTVEVFWFYQTSVCNGTPPVVWNLPRTAAQYVVLHDTYTDWTLLVLRDQIPGGVVFEGWDPDPWPNYSPAVGIHHPDTSYKRIAFGIKMGNYGVRPNPAGGLCISGEAHYISRTDGLTEHGSSGSPIFDANHRMRGVDSCGTGDCSDLGHASYGRLDAAWPLVSPWLTPADPMYVDGAFSGTELGTAANPFNSVQEGTAAVIRGSTVYVQDGTYNVSLVIEKDMTVRPWSGMARIVGQ